METAVRFLQIVLRSGDLSPEADLLTFGGVTLTFGGVPLTFQPA